MSGKTKKTSKFLSLVLRHKPEVIGISLDKEGWIETDKLLTALNENGKSISLQELEEIVANNDKKRFILENGRIRANQGHSINVDLALQASTPPKYLYHGTATRFLDSIMASGLEKRNRQHVHLSSDRATATKVGSRHGKPVILKVQAKRMSEMGQKFFLSKNHVWLTSDVPTKFLEVLVEEI